MDGGENLVREKENGEEMLGNEVLGDMEGVREHHPRAS
jgi:hypothetical protein